MRAGILLFAEDGTAFYLAISSDYLQRRLRLGRRERLLGGYPTASGEWVCAKDSNQPLRRDAVISIVPALAKRARTRHQQSQNGNGRMRR